MYRGQGGTLDSVVQESRNDPDRIGVETYIELDVSVLIEVLVVVESGKGLLARVDHPSGDGHAVLNGRQAPRKPMRAAVHRLVQTFRKRALAGGSECGKGQEHRGAAMFE